MRADSRGKHKEYSLNQKITLPKALKSLTINLRGGYCICR